MKKNTTKAKIQTRKALGYYYLHPDFYQDDAKDVKKYHHLLSRNLHGLKKGVIKMVRTFTLMRLVFEIDEEIINNSIC